MGEGEEITSFPAVGSTWVMDILAYYYLLPFQTSNQVYCIWKTRCIYSISNAALHSR